LVWRPAIRNADQIERRKLILDSVLGRIGTHIGLRTTSYTAKVDPLRSENTAYLTSIERTTKAGTITGAGYGVQGSYLPTDHTLSSFQGAR
jgi:hypothetical protein